MDSRLILHTFLALLLLAIPAGALYFLERNKLVKFVAVIVRMVVQLLVLCLLVWAILKVDSPWLSMLWLLAMAVGSSWLVQKRCALQGSKLMPAIALGFWRWFCPYEPSMLVGLYQ